MFLMQSKQSIRNTNCNIKLNPLQNHDSHQTCLTFLNTIFGYRQQIELQIRTEPCKLNSKYLQIIYPDLLYI